MKKYIIGAIMGFMLSLGVGAHAEVVNMIGQVIDGAFNVKVNGVQLANQAIVVQGTSYLPVREFGEATGYAVGFDADLGITMTKQEVTPIPTPSVQPTSPPDAEIRGKKIVALQKEIEDKYDEASKYYGIFSPYEDPTMPKEKDETYYTNKKLYEDKQAEISDLKKQMVDLQNQK